MLGIIITQMYYAYNTKITKNTLKQQNDLLKRDLKDNFQLAHNSGRTM